MSARALIDRAAALGIDLTVESDQIAIEPAGRMPADLREQLAATKTEVLVILCMRAKVRDADPSASGSAVAPRPVDPQGQLTNCRLCFTSIWWRLRDAGNGRPGDWVCSTCHPPFPAEAEIERSEARHA